MPLRPAPTPSFAPPRSCHFFLINWLSKSDQSWLYERLIKVWLWPQRKVSVRSSVIWTWKNLINYLYQFICSVQAMLVIWNLPVIWSWISWFLILLSGSMDDESFPALEQNPDRSFSPASIDNLLMSEHFLNNQSEVLDCPMIFPHPPCLPPPAIPMHGHQAGSLSPRALAQSAMSGQCWEHLSRAQDLK